jgi:hypothetical protein
MTQAEIYTLEAIGEGAIEFPKDSVLLQVAQSASNEAERLHTPWFFGEILWEKLERNSEAMSEFKALTDSLWDSCPCCNSVKVKAE